MDEVTSYPANLKLGCPVWAHAPWVGNFFTSDAKRTDYLAQYGSVFNTVEGNSSFYGLPAPQTIERWQSEVPADFEFCFKFPRVVSHDLLLKNAERETGEFVERLAPLGKNLGPFFLQLPPHFEARHLPNLAKYLERLPSEYQYAVEVRNPCFFSGGPDEIELNDLLKACRADRVIFDARALFEGRALDEDTEQAQRRKPNLPVKKMAIGNQPFIRFVGHPLDKVTHPILEEWVEPLVHWMQEGRTPYFFTHMPDDRLAPGLARRLQEMLAGAGAEIDPSPWPFELELPCPQQMDLFS